jgi:hypothetical protein
MNNKILVILLIWFHVSTLVDGGAEETPAQNSTASSAIGSVTGATTDESGSDSANSADSTDHTQSPVSPPKEQPISSNISSNASAVETIENGSLNQSPSPGDGTQNDTSPSSTAEAAGSDNGDHSYSKVPVSDESPDGNSTTTSEDSEREPSSGNDTEERVTTESDSMIDPVPDAKCFITTEMWQSDLLRRVIVVEDNVRYQIVSLLGPATANRRLFLRRALYHLMLLEKIITQVSTLPENESGTSDTLMRSERNLNRIGWIVYRGRNGWHFYDCCYQSFGSEEPIETMCGQKGDIDNVNRIYRI